MTKQQRLVLAVSILASFVAFLDGSIVNVALPAIQRDLGGGLSVQQWVVDAYLLTLGSLILIAGSLSDLLGRKKILTLGLIGFGAASLLCAAAPSGSLLVIFRALQGVAGALLVPSSLAIIISTFSGAAQGKAIGTWTAWTGIAFVIGPLLGGFLVDSLSWRLIFAINVLPIAATLYLLRRVQVKDQTKKAAIDVVGAVLCALGLGGPVFALIEQPHYGWSDPLIYLPLAVGAVIFAAFLIYESRARQPMLKLGLFRRWNFSVGNVATLAIYAGLSVSTFLIVLFLQQVSGYSALRAGLAMLPVTIIMFLLSPRAGALSSRYGPRFFMGFGPLIAGLGFVLVARLPLDFNYWTQLLPGIIVFGVGLSITVAPLTAAILGDVPEGEAGIASAVNNAVARVAGLVAVAAVGAIVALQFGSQLDKLCAAAPARALAQAKQAALVTTPPRPYQHDVSFKIALQDASVSAFHTGMNVTAGLVIAGGLISLIGIKNPKSKAADLKT
ncbi:MAG TPA: MFS transporter [Candidatus Saccharimonadales bacterium]|nr:MFS transporter [Candidatus Saccharimonadales bacterium]